MQIDWERILSGTNAVVRFEYKDWGGAAPLGGCDILLLGFPDDHHVELQWDDDEFYVVSRYENGWDLQEQTEHATADAAIAAVRDAAVAISRPLNMRVVLDFVEFKPHTRAASTSAQVWFTDDDMRQLLREPALQTS